MEAAINSQINAEIFSSYLYYSMAAYFDSEGLKGFAHWMRVQALEEMSHAHKFIQYVADRGGRVLMTAIDAPQTDWESALEVVQEVYDHEVKVTGLINGLMDVAIELRDHASVSFLSWFIDEQVEEEATADEIVQKLKMVEKTNGGIFMLDREVDQRTFTLPPNLVGAF
jgi:ferritin